MSYHVDLNEFSMDNYENELREADLLPSRRILKEKLAQNFKVLKHNGINNLSELVKTLRTKNDIQKFSENTGIDRNYLEILKRQTKIYTPTPIKLKEIPELDKKIVSNLEQLGIKNTKQLWEKSLTKKAREKLAEAGHCPLSEIDEIAKLSDLARAGWVGPIFARMLYETGYDTIKKLTSANAQKLFDKLMEVNTQNKYTRVNNITVNDMATTINASKVLPQILEI